MFVLSEFLECCSSHQISDLLVRLVKKSTKNLGFFGKICCQHLRKKFKMFRISGRNLRCPTKIFVQNPRCPRFFQDLGQTNMSYIQTLYLHIACFTCEFFEISKLQDSVTLSVCELLKYGELRSQHQMV